MLKKYVTHGGHKRSWLANPIINLKATCRGTFHQTCQSLNKIGLGVPKELQKLGNKYRLNRKLCSAMAAMLGDVRKENEQEF